jgi:hypothetical protein
MSSGVAELFACHASWRFAGPLATRRKSASRPCRDVAMFSSRR